MKRKLEIVQKSILIFLLLGIIQLLILKSLGVVDGLNYQYYNYLSSVALSSSILYKFLFILPICLFYKQERK